MSNLPIASCSRERLSYLLNDPPFKMGVAELAGLWSVDTVRFVCVRPHDFEEHPELPVRLRGAFGRQLTAMARLHRGDTLPAAIPLFEPLAQGEDGSELPKPFAIRTRLIGEHLIVDLSLFGMAAAWHKEAAAAMSAALVGGIALKAGARQRLPLVITEAGWRRSETVAVPETGSLARLRFAAPVVVRVGRLLSADTRSILRSAIRSVAAMARWQGVRLQHDQLRLVSLIDGLDIDDRELVEYSFTRNSIRQRDRPIEVRGYLGVLGASGRLGPLLPYLALAETQGVGSHVSLGLGSFDLAVHP